MRSSFIELTTSPICFTRTCTLGADMFAGGASSGRRVVPNKLLAGLLAVFVGGSYFTIIKRVSSDDLERELERELEDENRRQLHHQAKQGQ